MSFSVINKLHTKKTTYVVFIALFLVLVFVVYQPDHTTQIGTPDKQQFQKIATGIDSKSESSQHEKTDKQTKSNAGPALAYEDDNAKVWDLRFKAMEIQKSKSNSVTSIPLGETKHKDFFQCRWEPTFGCSVPVRIGNIGDGGKWICNPYQILQYKKDLSEPVIVYSLGSASDYSFETGIQEFFKTAEIHTFDLGKPIATIFMPKYINFHQYEIVGVGADTPLKKRYEAADENTKKRSLVSIMKELKHEYVDILKMDIEGGEYSALQTYVTESGGCKLNTNILLLETHWDTVDHYNEIFMGLQNVCGMELYYKEPNIQYSDGSVLEWCWVKVDWKQRPQ